MGEHWVLNASPLILLSKIQYDWLFFELAEEVIVPMEVAKEIERGPAEDRARQLLADARFLVADTEPMLAEIIA